MIIEVFSKRKQRNSSRKDIKMKKVLVFVVVLANLVLGVQGFSRVSSEEFERIMDKALKEYDKGNKQRAISTLKEEISKDPSAIELKVMLGALYTDMGKNSEGNRELNEAVEMQKKYPFVADDGKKYDIRLLIGSIYMEMEEYEKSLKWFSEIDDNYMKGLVGFKEYLIGLSNYMLGNTEEAKKYLLKSYVEDEDGLSENILGQIYFDEGNQKEAIKWFLKSESKGNSGAQASLGIMYYQLGDKDVGLKWLKKAFETAKKDKDDEQMKDIQEVIKEVENDN